MVILAICPAITALSAIMGVILDDWDTFLFSIALRLYNMLVLRFFKPPWWDLIACEQALIVLHGVGVVLWCRDGILRMLRD